MKGILLQEKRANPPGGLAEDRTDQQMKWDFIAKTRNNTTSHRWPGGDLASQLKLLGAAIQLIKSCAY